MSKRWSDIEDLFQDQLKSLYPKEEIYTLFLMAIEEIAAIHRASYSIRKTEYISETEEKKTAFILQELASAKPIQHILGKAYFYGNHFQVNEHTLIPRPETEELVHLILQDYKTQPPQKIIDIGTGTGCIPISLYKNLKSETWAIEISEQAIQIAKQNAQNLKANINFILADILEWEFIFSEKQNFDVIVSNPPYITPQEKADMHLNVLNFEPHTALFVEDTAPLIFYDYIADFAKYHLAKNGTLYFEINQYLSHETTDLLRKKGFNRVEIIKDINDVDRIIRATGI